jgi:hypothetical protein
MSHTGWRIKHGKLMAKKSWLKIIGKLKKFIADVGPLWPDSTKLSGFASDGPYHCGNCEYFKGDKVGVCTQAVVIADPEVKKNNKGLPIIDDPEHQCCEFVEPPKKKSEKES